MHWPHLLLATDLMTPNSEIGKQNEGDRRGTEQDWSLFLFVPYSFG